MSHYGDQPKLFKATRRFIVAEITLIIVIVILFTWSSYVLYKLFASDSDTLFGISLKPASLSKSEQPNNRTNRPDAGQLLNLRPQPDYGANERSIPTTLLDQANVQEQLANYKDQILRELLARQQKLLGDDGGDRLMSSLLGLIKTDKYANNHPTTEHRAEPSIRELQQWQGGYRFPPSWDYLFNNKRQVSRERLPAASVNSPMTAPLSGGGSKPNAPIYLEDAPSLMQLVPTPDPGDASGGIITTTIGPNSMPTESSDGLLNNDEQQEDVQTTTESSIQATDAETTTLEPAVDDNEVPTTTLSPNSDPDSSEPKSVGQDEEQDSGGDKNESNDPADDERVRNTVKSIDEEVDRMTQPSLGSVSQQDKPAELRDTVQFDDSTSTDLNDGVQGGRGTVKRSKMSKHTGQKGDELEINDQRNRRLDRQGHFDSPPNDLSIADNLFKPPVSSSLNLNRVDSPPSKARVRHPSRNSHSNVTTAHQEPTSNSTRNLADSIESRKQLRHGDRRLKRSLVSNFQFGSSILPISKKLLLRSKRTTNRIDDDDDEYDEDTKSLLKSVMQPENDDGKNTFGTRLTAIPLQPSLEQKQFSANDPSFEELLAHKQLLDALQQSQLPAPEILLNSSLARRPINGEDHQSADSHYSLDHGLMLYPSENEEHHHKSKSHKSSKAKKKKSKKKMTAAVKKGGHKSKKHKKEEKKYHKEKKFKGAKKGKKMKKGKGGKGGKKGKKLFKDKGYKKKGFKKTYVKNEFGSKKSYFDEFRDKDFKKKWKNFDDKYHYAQMKKWQAKDIKKAKKMKDHGEKYKKYDKGKWKKTKHAEMSSGSKKSKSKHHKEF